MREILFRGKRLDNGEWVYGGYYWFYKSFCNSHGAIMAHYIVPTFLPMLSKLKDIRVDPSTVGQFTENREFTYDENGNVTYGKNIFDGDIIKVMSTEDGDSTYLVFWNDEKGEWDSKQLSGGCQSEDYVDAVKIIGNRIDNPEMLSQ